jgi:uncharacterized protein (TIGR01777 family)
MRVILAGGSGFLGSALSTRLRRDGHEVTLLTRRPRQQGDLGWNPARPEGPWIDAIARADAVVNLAGESIEGGRWTPARKQAILDSRVQATRAIVAAIEASLRPPALVSASAIGIYGPRDDEPLNESSAPGSDFLAGVCVAWEREAMAAAARTRVALVRTGLVLDRRAGALPRMARPFQFLAGGPLGSGRQWWSWIHVDDWVSMVAWMLDTEVAGPYNATAPSPVTNRAFAATLGRVLHRPSFMPAPAFALRLLLGEMADALIVSGQRVLPARALDAGFRFRFESLESALRAIYG